MTNKPVAEQDAEFLRFPPGSPYYSRQQVLELVPVAYASMWAWMRDGQFPQAREIGPGGRRCKIGWLKSEVDEWIVNRPRRAQKSRIA
jgi:predicted DNA-binding transcriptional regulator AlpA